MLSRTKKFAIAGTCAGALIAGTAAASFANADAGDNFSRPAGTVETAALKTGTTMNFKGTIDGVAITVKCTGFKASGKLPATGLTVTLTNPPTISGCTDSLGGTDTVTTNQTNGKWKLQEVDAPATSDTVEPNTGDKAVLIIPKAGATFKSSILSSCTVTAAPSGAARVSGTYNDINTIHDNGANIPTAGTGCTTAANAHVVATVVLSPTVHDTK
ncbi:MAG: hypothetical protein J2P57_01465 [Acidimicrobiaceae bacterium]|nr:hypothetical protein [Acidimicrobiaceae bacterium]